MTTPDSPEVAPELVPIISAVSRLFNDGRDQPDQYVTHRSSVPSYYADAATQRDEPGWAAETAAYLNRMLVNRDGRRSLELAELDLTQTTPETAWLLKHLIINRPPPLPPDLPRYDRLLKVLPNLRPLTGLVRAEVRLPIVTTTRPLRCYPYLEDRGIIV